MTRGDDLYSQALSKMNAVKIPWFTDLVARYETCGELFARAGEMFKMEKNLEMAYKATRYAGECFNMASDPFKAGEYMNKAGDIADRRGLVYLAIKDYNSAISYYSEHSESRMVLRIYKKIADLLEKDSLTDTESLVNIYTVLVDLNESYGSVWDTCMYKERLADLSAIDHPEEGAKAYESLANIAVEGSLSVRFKAKGYLYKASLCKILLRSAQNELNDDLLDLNRVFDRYRNIEPAFGDICPEARFVRKIAEAVIDNNIDLFQDQLDKRDAIVPFNKWELRILTRIKEALTTLA